MDPVKALQYDIKNIPSFTKAAWSETQIKAYAQKVTLKEKEALLNDAILRPFEEKWYKIDVKKGEYVQFELEGASQFDYKLMLYLDSKDRQERLDVNKVLEDKKEGKLYEAPFTGTLYFGVKDVNGSYDDSSQQCSHYSLSVQNLTKLPEDESSIA